MAQRTSGPPLRGPHAPGRRRRAGLIPTVMALAAAALALPCPVGAQASGSSSLTIHLPDLVLLSFAGHDAAATAAAREAAGRDASATGAERFASATGGGGTLLVELPVTAAGHLRVTATVAGSYLLVQNEADPATDVVRMTAYAL